jgi:hypothetical protein
MDGLNCIGGDKSIGESIVEGLIDGKVLSTRSNWLFAKRSSGAKTGSSLLNIGFVTAMVTDSILSAEY